jgi:hypothetical protein
LSGVGHSAHEQNTAGPGLADQKDEGVVHGERNWLLFPGEHGVNIASFALARERAGAKLVKLLEAGF